MDSELDSLDKFWDHYLSLPSTDWFGRLLAPGTIRELCRGDAGAPWGTADDWTAIELPCAVVHPGCRPNNEVPLETLLGIDTAALEQVIFGPASFGAPDVWVVTDPGSSALTLGQLVAEEALVDGASGLQGVEGLLPALRALHVPGPAGTTGRLEAHLRNLAARDARPEWMILEVLPLPPASMLDASVREGLTRLQQRGDKIRRLIELRAPALLVRSQKGFFQGELDALYPRIVESLRV